MHDAEAVVVHLKEVFRAVALLRNELCGAEHGEVMGCGLLRNAGDSRDLADRSSALAHYMEDAPASSVRERAQRGVEGFSARVHAPNTSIYLYKCQLVVSLTGVDSCVRVRNEEEFVGTHETIAVVRTYHQGWTAKRYDEAIAALAPDLVVEVPINAYPTKASFADAVIAFASRTRSVDLLAEMGDGDQAMLLYDMDIEILGTLRVAEHFTVADGKIVRVRQIHDTFALRNAGS